MRFIIVHINNQYKVNKFIIIFESLYKIQLRITKLQLQL